MPLRNLVFISIMALSLAACGGSEAEDPVEQIVVREPGATGAEASDSEPGDLAMKGRAAFAACVACHGVEKGAASGVGPNLHAVMGRKAGTLDNFGYSNALAASGIVWDEASMDAFLTNPSAKVPGTSMVAGAVGNPEQRKAIIAYLASLPE